MYADRHSYHCVILCISACGILSTIQIQNMFKCARWKYIECRTVTLIFLESSNLNILVWYAYANLVFWLL